MAFRLHDSTIGLYPISAGASILNIDYAKANNTFKQVKYPHAIQMTLFFISAGLFQQSNHHYSFLLLVLNVVIVDADGGSSLHTTPLLHLVASGRHLRRPLWIATSLTLRLLRCFDRRHICFARIEDQNSDKGCNGHEYYKSSISRLTNTSIVHDVIILKVVTATKPFERGLEAMNLVG